MYLFFIYAPVCILCGVVFVATTLLPIILTLSVVMTIVKLNQWFGHFNFFEIAYFFIYLQNLLLLCVYLAKFGNKRIYFDSCFE